MDKKKNSEPKVNEKKDSGPNEERKLSINKDAKPNEYTCTRTFNTPTVYGYLKDEKVDDKYSGYDMVLQSVELSNGG